MLQGMATDLLTITIFIVCLQQIYNKSN